MLEICFAELAPPHAYHFHSMEQVLASKDDVQKCIHGCNQVFETCSECSVCQSEAPSV